MTEHIESNHGLHGAIKETRAVALARDGNLKASRWCAGCHDPVPFLSGGFDDPNFDVEKDPTGQAGLTCTVCHAITHVNSTVGNGDYTIDEPVHYPFAYSSNPTLQYVNQLLVKAKPEFHKKTFLKPFMRTAEYCSLCHKVSLPREVTQYKDFLRGQNHYDTYLLSGVSGDNGVLDTVGDVITQNFLLDASQCRAYGGDLRDDIDAVAIILDHAGEAADLTFDAAQALQAGGFRAFRHA